MARYVEKLGGEFLGRETLQRRGQARMKAPAERLARQVLKLEKAASAHPLADLRTRMHRP